MSPGAGFATFLLLTILILGGVVATGYTARRRTHLTLVGTALASLGATIFFAEKLGQLYDLEVAGLITPVHLFVAKLTVAAYLLPIATGIWTLRDPRKRTLHRRAAFLVLGLTLVTAVTGTWMLLASEPLETSTPHRLGRAGAL